jgi:prepilin-type N-terminal cleavage/methylation domain-containing protein/prepilin-type processing-associated H-X9-DG protein
VSKKKGFTLIELLVVVAIIALLISILLPSLARAREITKRAVCATNLRSLGQGMKVYANENFDMYPMSMFEGATTGDVTNVNFEGAMGANLTVQLTSSNMTFVHPSRSVFILVSDSGIAAKQFTCPSAGDLEDDMRIKDGSTDRACQPGIDRFDFRGYPYLSYGYQNPFGMRARPSENLDSRVALMADKGPFFTAGSTDTSDGHTPDAWGPFAPNYDLSLPEVPDNITDILKADNEKWRIYNSRNHSGEGENMLFADGHAEFMKRPCAGVNYDNVYSMQGMDRDLKGCVLGRTPSQNYGPLTHTDSVIIP